MSRPGRLDQKIDFYREIEADDGQGGDDITDELIASGVWVSVRPISGKEHDRFDKLNATEVCVFEGRPRTDVTPKDKILYRGEWYNIVWMPRVSSRELYQKYYAERGVAQ